MSDRDRLIELILQGENEADKKGIANCQMYNLEKAKILADYLLANGVIVSPVKVGDMFYIVKSYTNSYLEIVSREVVSTLVKEILINKNGISIVTEEAEYNAEDIGDLIFLTKKEAEEKLRKRSEDNAL